LSKVLKKKIKPLSKITECGVTGKTKHSSLSSWLFDFVGKRTSPNSTTENGNRNIKGKKKNPAFEVGLRQELKSNNTF